MPAAKDDVYAILFDKILRGEYDAGTRLKEDELCHEFSISRTPIREAFRLLAQDGLLELTHNKGAHVVGFTMDDVEEIYEIRKSLETLALKTATPLLSINALSLLRNEFVAAADENNAASHEQLDARLHNLIVTASGKKRLARILAQLLRLIHQFRELGFRDTGVRASALKSHLDLIDALCVRDLTAATRIMERHLEESKRNAIALIAINA